MRRVKVCTCILVLPLAFIGGWPVISSGADYKAMPKEELIEIIRSGQLPEKADLSGADLTGATLDSANLPGAVLWNANLAEASLWTANLTGAFLVNANLTDATLAEANLTDANLGAANLTGASLHFANLTGADLREANLTGAKLPEANLTGADLREADLTGAKLPEANLTGADLREADLTGADLVEANLTGTTLAFANLSGMTFEPEAGTLPLIPSLATARGLPSMTFETSPHGLHELREAFKKEGMRNQEREVTYAIEHTIRLHLKKEGFWGRAESAFKLVLFEWTCDYGMSPGRALRILAMLIPLFALPYIVSLRVDGQDGIWKVWSEERMRKDLGSSEPERITAKPNTAILTGLYFSILSAFHIGWRDLNVGNWIARIQSREYTLRATGWVRTISGIQSLISVYLLALWALTYFGRPFE